MGRLELDMARAIMQRMRAENPEQCGQIEHAIRENMQARPGESRRETMLRNLRAALASGEELLKDGTNDALRMMIEPILGDIRRHEFEAEVLTDEEWERAHPLPS